MIIDSHCHLTYDPLWQSHQEIIKQASASGISKMLTISTQTDDFDKITSLINNYDHIYGSYGVHPCYVKEEQRKYTNHNPISHEEIIEICQNNHKIIGIGETGLDYFHSSEDKHLQQLSLIEHIKACQKSGLPLIVHTRDAEADTLKILKQHYNNAPYKGLIHCFTASEQFAHEVLAIGFYISISGIITFKNAKKLQSIVANIPIERILVETDSPYLAPYPHRGKTNEPAYTKYVVEKIAQLKNISFQEVAEQTTKNFNLLFSHNEKSSDH